MHEFPEVQELVRRACAKLAPGQRVRRLRIVVGEASGHDAGHIAAHFREAAQGTPAEGALLEFIPEKLSARCAGCGAAYPGAAQALTCPTCGGTELVFTGGRDVRLEGVDVASRS